MGARRRASLRRCASTGAFAAVALTTALAPAQETQGRFQLGLEGTVAAAESGSMETSSGANIDTSGSSLGIPAGLGLVLGYGVSDSVVLGARVSQAARSFTAEADGVSSEDRTSTFDVLPRVELILGSGNPRTSLFGTVGYRSLVTQTTAELNDPTLGTVSDRSRIKSSGIAFGAGLGLHGFVGDNVSLDAGLGVLRASGDSEASGDTGSFASTGVLLTVGISAWLGGKPAAVEQASRHTEAPVAEPIEAKPSERTVVSANGVLSRATELRNGAELRFAAHPSKDGEHVFFRLSLLGMAPPDLESWLDCTEGGVLAGDETLPLDNVVVDESQKTPAARGRVSVRSLIRLVRAKELAALEICSDRNHLGEAAQGALLEFLLAFKKSAERHGTWQTGVTAPNDATLAAGETEQEQAAIHLERAPAR